MLADYRLRHPPPKPRKGAPGASRGAERGAGALEDFPGLTTGPKPAWASKAGL